MRYNSFMPQFCGDYRKLKMNDKYQAACDVHKTAAAKFDIARTAYRALKIGDAEFLAAKKEYDAATKAYDVAFETACA